MRQGPAFRCVVCQRKKLPHSLCTHSSVIVIGSMCSFLIGHKLDVQRERGKAKNKYLILSNKGKTPHYCSLILTFKKLRNCCNYQSVRIIVHCKMDGFHFPGLQTIFIYTYTEKSASYLKLIIVF